MDAVKYVISILKPVRERVKKDKQNPTREDYQKAFEDRIKEDFVNSADIFEFLKDNYNRMPDDDELIDNLRQRVIEFLSLAVANHIVKYIVL